MWWLKKKQDAEVTTCAILVMYFTPEGTSAFEKAKYYCKLYDVYHEKIKTGRKTWGFGAVSRW